MIWFRKLHKWIGLAIGIQVALWMVSGFMMGLLDHDRVEGHHTRAEHLEASLLSQYRNVLEPAEILARLPQQLTVHGVDLITLLDRPLYRAESGGSQQLFDGYSGEKVEITADLAGQIAERDYSGSGAVSGISRVQAPSREIRKHHGPAWRIDFDDEQATALYVSATDGAILERRNNTWRLFDVFWMLHIMDYKEREDFNNALLIIVSLIAAWFSVTGIVLFFDSFRKSDFLGFLPEKWWRKRARIAVCAPHGEVVSRIDSFSGGRLYDELANAQIVLPSNCGGGGTCGLCVVMLQPDWPESAADRRLIPEYQRRQGIRLACQAEIASDMSVKISEDVLSAEILNTRVVGTRLLTPFIKEITLKPEKPVFEYTAGSYVHVVIPAHKFELADIESTPEIRSLCPGIRPGLKQSSEQELRRAYSLAAAPADSPGTIVLNVRFMPPPSRTSSVPCGIGSSFMWSLKKADSLELVGPLGDFKAQDSERHMIFIGGGAGMAPLRSIIRDELQHKKSGRKIDYWYGCRSRADLFYSTEFDELQAAHPNFRWQPVLSEPLTGDAWTGPTGFVHEAIHAGLFGKLESLELCEFYVCGPPAMLAATRAMLGRLGVPESQVFFDDFGI